MTDTHVFMWINDTIDYFEFYAVLAVLQQYNDSEYINCLSCNDIQTSNISGYLSKINKPVKIPDAGVFTPLWEFTAVLEWKWLALRQCVSVHTGIN